MRHLAIDIGANGGTAYLGERREDELSLTEVHRFDNRPVERDGRYVWDVERLLDELSRAIRTAHEGDPIESVGINTWGLDFGLLADGELLRAPYSYRDPTVVSTRDRIVERVDRRRLFEATGINHRNTPNTLWQYHYLAREEPDLLEAADRLLLMPQLFSHLLGADAVAEETIASTTQMLDPRRRTWTTELLADLDLPTDLLPPVRPADTRAGRVDSSLVDGDPPEFVLTASHDTASAVAGLPLDDDHPAFLCTGTWFLVGLELDEPNLSRAAFEAGASNELGVDDTTRFLRNLTGFFLFEECREAWRDAGRAIDYESLLAAAAEADPFGPLIDPDDSRFDIVGSMPTKIRADCRERGSPLPEGRGALARCLFESLAVKTALTLETLLDVTGKTTDRIHVGGGGVRNELFCRLLASASGRPVVAGPTEATAVGNLLTQLRAFDGVADLTEGRRLVRNSTDFAVYEPVADDRWRAARERMRTLVGE